MGSLLHNQNQKSVELKQNHLQQIRDIEHESLLDKIVFQLFVVVLKRYNKTHQAVFASEENVHGTDDPISKDQSQPETNEGDILK